MKPGVFTQLHTQLVFAVKYRQCLLNEAESEEIYAYIGGIIRKRNHKCILINGISNHIHILIGANPAESLSNLVANIKRDSSKFINERKWFRTPFNWQEGYGAFATCKSHLDVIYKYIQNQKEHHRTKTFKEEYIAALIEYGIEYDERFLFTFFD